jgi:hypothetical protein
LRTGAFSDQRSAFSVQLLHERELEYRLLLARDLKLIKPKDYEQLAQRTTEVKRMLTVAMEQKRANSASPLRPHPSARFAGIDQHDRRS